MKSWFSFSKSNSKTWYKIIKYDVIQVLVQKIFNVLMFQLIQQSFSRTRCWMNNLHNCLTFQNSQTFHPTTRRRSHVVTTSLCTSQQGRTYVSNETPNDVSKELHQDVLVVRLHDILFKHRDDVSRRRNNDVPSVRLLDVSDNSQMKHPTMSQWCVTKTSQWCQEYYRAKLSNILGGTYPWRPISTSLQRLL